MPSFSATLEEAIHKALELANERRHELSTLEHLLLALTEERDAKHLMLACAVDLDSLREAISAFLNEELNSLIADYDESEAAPTAAFQRVIQRAAIHVQSSGRPEVTGANVIVAIFAERESHAAYFLQEQNMTRYDAVNFIAHGVTKDPAFDEPRILDPYEENEEQETEEKLTEQEWRERYPEMQEMIDKLEALQATTTGQTQSENSTSTNPKAPFVFLSYSSKDRDLVREIRGLLNGSGVKTWWDQDIEPGAAWRETIDQKLVAAAAVLTFWTENSVASPAVTEEASNAQAKRKLVHIKLDNCQLPYGFAETQYVDFKDWDGTTSHDLYRRVLYNLRDRTGVKSADTVSARLAASSPVQLVPNKGKLTTKDAPVNVPPVFVNEAELSDRLEALGQTLRNLKSICGTGDFNFPPALHHSLGFMLDAVSVEKVTWYALEDAKIMLVECMTDNFASDAWNATVYKGLCGAVKRVDEIKPYLQPAQIIPETSEKRPPSPDPIITNEDADEVVEAAEAISEEFKSEEAEQVFDAETQKDLVDSVEFLKSIKSLATESEEKKLSRMRRVTKKIAYIAGGAVMAIGTGVVINLLTSPTAATTLLARLQPLYEALLKVFM